MRLVLARHGESVWNEVRRFQGGSDIALSERGRAQARALGQALRPYRLAAAYVSPLGRARETAEIAMGDAGVPIVPLQALREMSLGEWEGCLSEEVRAREGDPYGAWVRAPLDCPPPGGEPLEDVRHRVLEAMDRITHAHPMGEDVLVVAHGGVISVYACHLLGCSFNALWRLRVDNASLTVVRPPRLVTLNDTRHLAGLELVHLTGPSARPSAASGPRSSGGFAAAIDIPGEGVGRRTEPPSDQSPGEVSEGAVEAPSEGA